MTNEPQPLPLEELQEKARGDALALARRVFGGEILATPTAPTIDWNTRDRLFVYDDLLTIWKRFTAFEVITDGEDEVVGFVDEDKWADCRSASLDDDRALELLRDTGLFRGRLTVMARREGPNGCAELIIRSESHPAGLLRRARLNPVSRAVIAVEPVAGGAP